VTSTIVVVVVVVCRLFVDERESKPVEGVPRLPIHNWDRAVSRSMLYSSDAVIVIVIAIIIVIVIVEQYYNEDG